MILLKGFLVIPIISLTKNPSKRIINVTFLSKRTRLYSILITNYNIARVNNYEHSICLVNLHPLFLFLKHGPVCDPEKNQVQNMDLKKQGEKNRVIAIHKEKKPICLFSFLITMTLFFAPCFFSSIFWTKSKTLKNIRST